MTMTNIARLEQKIISFLAEQLNLEVDRNCFRGALPPEKINAFSFEFISFDRGNGDKALTLSALCHGRFSSRDEALALAGKLDYLLPYYGAEFSLLKDSVLSFDSVYFAGNDVTAFSLELQIKFFIAA